MPDFCIHDFVREECSYCKPQPLPQYWDSLYTGVCERCDREIAVGDRVTWNLTHTAPIHARHGRG